MRWLFAILGIIVGMPIGTIIGGIPTVMIFAAVNRTLDFPYLDDFTGLSLALRLVVIVTILIVTFGGGILGGILGYKFGNRI